VSYIGGFYAGLYQKTGNKFPDGNIMRLFHNISFFDKDLFADVHSLMNTVARFEQETIWAEAELDTRIFVSQAANCLMQDSVHP
jgi:hypothetical protein